MEEARAVMAEHLELLEYMEARRSLWADREGRVLKILEKQATTDHPLRSASWRGVKRESVRSNLSRD